MFSRNSIRKLFLSIALFFVIMCETFLLPCFSIYYNSSNSREIITIIIALAILLLNSLPFIFQSEIIKIISGNKDAIKDLSYPYEIIYLKNYLTTFLVVRGVGTIALVWLYYFLLGISQLNELILYSLCVFISYTMCIFTFDRFRKKSIFLKRVFLILQPFAMFSLPLSCSFYVIDTLNSNLEYVSLLVIISLFLSIYSLLSYKYDNLTKEIYALITISIALALGFIYYGFGFTKTTIIHSNTRVLMISVFYGIYLSLLYGLSYTFFYHIKTEAFRHSINKFLTSLFNISPFLALPVLLFCFDSEPLIYCYIIINIIAVNFIGQIKKNTKIVVSVLLIFMFIAIVMGSIKYANEHIFDYDIVFEFDSELLAILSVIPISGLFKIISKNMVSINFSVLRKYRCYYVTYIINYIVLVLESTLFNVYKVYEEQRILLSERPIYLYLLLSLAIVIIRTLYILFSQNAISKKE